MIDEPEQPPQRPVQGDQPRTAASQALQQQQVGTDKPIAPSQPSTPQSGLTPDSDAISKLTFENRVLQAIVQAIIITIPAVPALDINPVLTALSRLKDVNVEERAEAKKLIETALGASQA